MYRAAIAAVFVLPLLAGPAQAGETADRAIKDSSAGAERQTEGIELPRLARSVIGK